MKSKTKLIHSTWFWFYILGLTGTFIGWYSDINKTPPPGIYEVTDTTSNSPILWLSTVLINHHIFFAVSLLIAFALSKIFKTKNLVLDLIGVSGGILLNAYVTSKLIYSLFFPLGLIIYYTSVTGVLAGLLSFTIIHFIIFFILKYKKGNSADTVSSGHVTNS